MERQWTKPYILLTLAMLFLFTGFYFLLPTLPHYVKELGARPAGGGAAHRASGPAGHGHRVVHDRLRFGHRDRFDPAWLGFPARGLSRGVRLRRRLRRGRAPGLRRLGETAAVAAGFGGSVRAPRRRNAGGLPPPAGRQPAMPRPAGSRPAITAIFP
jgi:hypothetical protein